MKPQPNYLAGRRTKTQPIAPGWFWVGAFALCLAIWVLAGIGLACLLS
jgi:hypothetical protein